jgi:hypothetical protein
MFSPATLASSPPRTPSSPSPSKLQAQCICVLSEITNQLLNDDTVVRFQCLAYHRYGRSPTQTRCKESCIVPSMPHVFKRAKQILQQNSPVSFVDYAGVVIRILFCKTHCEARAFRKYHHLLEQHWEGDGAPNELELLEAIRQAYQLPSIHSVQVPDIVVSSSCSSSHPSRPKPETRGPNSNRQPNTLLVEPDRGRASSAPPEQSQPVAFVSSSLAERNHLAPASHSKRMRSRSNPPQQGNEISFAAGPSVHTAAKTTDDSPGAPAASKHYRIPSESSFEFSFPAHKTALTLRQVRDEATNLTSTQSESTSSSHKSDSLPFRTTLPSEQVTDPLPEATPASSLPNGSKPKAHNLNSFSPAIWDGYNFFSSFNLPGLGGDRFRPTTMAMRSEDDTFVEQLSSSVSSATPTLFQPATQHSIC